MAWIIDGNTAGAGDGPIAQGTIWPQAAEDNVIEHQPIGGTSTDSTVITFIGTPSRQAVLHFICSSTMRDILIALKQTTFEITDPWSNAADWYLKRLAISNVPHLISSPRYDIFAYLVGR